MIRMVAAFVVGSIFSGCSVYWYLNSVTVILPFDRNGDGSVDTQYFYLQGDVLSSLKMDRNHDGEIDNEIHFDRKGMPVLEFADDNFDGQYDTRISFSNGLMDFMESRSVSGDVVFKISYDFGVVSTIEYFDGDALRKVDISALRRGWSLGDSP
jgi:hypothetical protein